MKKLSLSLETLQVQSFETAGTGDVLQGTVHAFAPPQKTGPEDSNCSHIDACASSLGCTQFNCATMDLVTCESADDACPTGRGCTPLFPCA
jgi:hypothetical protein